MLYSEDIDIGKKLICIDDNAMEGSIHCYTGKIATITDIKHSGLIFNPSVTIEFDDKEKQTWDKLELSGVSPFNGIDVGEGAVGEYFRFISYDNIPNEIKFIHKLSENMNKFILHDHHVVQYVRRMRDEIDRAEFLSVL